MKANVIEKIQATNQKYLKDLIGKEVPQRLVDQLNNMDWSYLDMIGQNRKEDSLLLLVQWNFQKLKKKKQNSKHLV